VPTNVSEEHIASIFRLEEISSTRNQQASRWQAELRRAENLKSYISYDKFSLRK
jgi:hypothetical protein